MKLQIKSAALAVAGLLLLTTDMEATEKYWVVHEASLGVVGTFQPNPIFPFPWFDGWHFTGTIKVDELLFGSTPAGLIKYRYVCPYSSSINVRELWSTSSSRFLKAKAMWFLRPDGQSWQPSSGFGIVGIEARADFEKYVRRYKR